MNNTRWSNEEIIVARDALTARSPLTYRQVAALLKSLGYDRTPRGVQRKLRRIAPRPRSTDGLIGSRCDRWPEFCDWLDDLEHREFVARAEMKTVPLLDLRVNQCSWPHEMPDGSTQYCGNPVHAHSMCAKHHKMTRRKTRRLNVDDIMRSINLDGM